MSYKSKHFTLNLRLEHIAMVRTSEQLWRQPDVGAKVKEFVIQHAKNSRMAFNLPMYHKEYHKSYGSTDIIDYVIKNKLPRLYLPLSIRQNLEYYITSMAEEMFFWLFKTWESMTWRKDEKCEEKTDHFIEHISWTDIGYIDGRKMIESYVENLETIDHPTLIHLSNYCSEKMVIRYADCVDWDTWSQFDPTACAYWHHVVHGKFYDLERKWSVKGTMKSLLHDSMERGNMSGLWYFWDKCKNHNKIEILAPVYEKYFFRHCRDPSTIYGFLLSEMSQEQLKIFVTPMDEDYHSYHSKYFTKWPWLPCITSWRAFFMNFDKEYKFLNIILEKIIKCIGEERKRQSKSKFFRNIVYEKYFQIFVDLWEVHYKNSFLTLNPVYVYSLCSLALSTQDFNLCMFIFGGDGDRRKQLMEKLKSSLPITAAETPSDEFYMKFMKDVLINDEERAFYVTKFKQGPTVAAKWPDFIFNILSVLRNDLSTIE